MMQQDPTIAPIARVIQLSVAPVFLLSGIGAMLSVMTNRLARVVDRHPLPRCVWAQDGRARNRLISTCLRRRLP
jgi:hypothetical protein